MVATVGISRARVFLNDADGDGVADPGDKFVHTVIITNGAGEDALDLVDTETENGLSIDIGSIKIGPVAADDSLGTISGNTPFTFNAAQLTVNDIDPDDVTPNLTITSINGTSVVDINGDPISATVAVTGGTVTSNLDGSFTFTPTTGFEGAASFTYDVVDEQGVASVAATPGNVSITVGDCIWYVDSTGGNDVTGDGSLANPFASLAPLSTGGSADGLDTANDTIFVYANGADAYNSGIVLENGQTLRGEGTSTQFIVNGITVSAGGTDTQIEYTTFGAQLGQNNTITGIDFVGEADGAVGILDGNGNVGTLNVSQTEISGQGQIVDIDQGGTLAVTLESAASTGSSLNFGGVIDLTGVSGSFAVSGATTINGTQAQTGIDISGNNNLAVAFQGLTTVNTSATSQGAVNLATNTGTSTMGFAGLDIDTAGGTGLSVNAGGTLTVTGAGNAINTTTGQIVSIVGTSLGASGVTFATLGASGTVANTAISLNNVDGVGNTFSGGAVSIAGTSGAGSDGINVSNGSDANVSFTSATITTAADDGVEVNGSAGSFTLSGGSIGNVTDDGLNVTGGTGAVTFAASITKTSSGHVVEVNDHETGTVAISGTLSTGAAVSNGILVTNVNSGAVNFTGQTTLSTGTQAAVSLTNNTGGTIDFNSGGNGLDITTSTGTGFSASGGGTVTVQGAGNSITSVGGAALNVSGTTIGAADLNFVSVAANGGTNGIILNNTGSSGGLTITGTGAANSGGTIQNMSGDGIVITNAQDINFTNIKVINTVGHGINATNLGGVNTITNSTIQNWDTAASASKDGVHIVNNNTNMTSMIVTGTTFDGVASTPPAAGPNDGIFMEAQGSSNMALKVTGSTFTHMFGDAIQVGGIGGSTGTVNVKVLSSTFTNAVDQTAPNVGGGGGGIQLTPFGDVNMFAQIDSNSFTNIGKGFANTGAIYGTNGLTAAADITITNNTIKGVLGQRGMGFTTDGNSDTKILIQGNKIDDLGSNHAGISINITGAATGDITINNNQIGANGTVAGRLWTSATGEANNGILVQTQGTAQADVAVTNNVINGNTSSIFEVVRLRAIGTTTMNGTVTGNTISDTVGTHTEFDATAGNTGESGTINLNITGNTVPAAGVGRITLNEAGTGALIVTQASSAAVSTANNNATVVADAGVAFGGATPPTPTLPTLPSSPLLDATPADPATSGDPGGTSGTPPLGDDIRGGGDKIPAGDPQPDPQPDPHPVIVEDGVLSQAELNYLVDAAIQRWADAGASAEQLAAMRATAIGVADMTGLYLGTSSPGSIAIDSDGAGHGWFLDGTPGDDSEFEGSGSRLTADAGGAADGHMDLLTVLMHELGHQVGLDDLYGAGDAAELMYGYAVLGERRLPEADDLAAADPSQAPHGAFLVLPTTIDTVPQNHDIQIVYESTVDSFFNEIIPSGLTNTSSVSGTNFPTATTGAEALVIDTLTLGNLVFSDFDGNGLFDGADVGIDGVTLTLYADTNNSGFFESGTDVQLATTTTAGGGLYSFANLAHGNYIVVVDAANFGAGQALDGFVNSPGNPDPDTGNTDNDDNGAPGAGGIVVSQAISLEYNQEPTAGLGNDTNDTLDFGFVVFNDAVDDAFTTDEATSVTGQNLLTNDVGASPAVTAVNGDSGDVGSTITLPSGASLIVNSDGTFTYDPNGAFDFTPTVGSGASNTPSQDSFSYTVTGGDIATVTITITGLDSDDRLLGTPGVDTLDGGIGNDAIDGRGGADAMSGSKGDDIFFVDNPSDTVTEVAGDGRDKVYTMVTYTLASEVEDLSIVAAAGAKNGTGNGGANVLTGNGSANTLSGLGGADVLIGNGGDDILSGGLLGDQLFGGAGKDTLDGGNGDDKMAGGTEDDTYFVDSALDQVIEASSEGRDKVFANLSFILAANVDDLSLQPVAGVSDGTGNGLANVINGNASANRLYGLDGTDTLNGNGGDDIILGGIGVDQLFGNAGADSLDGGAGNDTMTGGTEDDLYFIDSASDHAVELGGQGRDKVYSDVTGYTLENNVEDLTLQAAAGAATATGNGGNNVITGNDAANTLSGLGGADVLIGNDGADTLIGGLGKDLLEGGNGADNFRFDAAPGPANADKIIDFSVVDDTIQLDNAAFTALSDGALPATAFVNGTSAGDSDDRILYDITTGALYYDADGTGAVAAVQFATVTAGTLLTFSDFTVI